MLSELCYVTLIILYGLLRYQHLKASILIVIDAEFKKFHSCLVDLGL